jgi:transcriptional regulator with XRE-family HTH domain
LKSEICYTLRNTLTMADSTRDLLGLSQERLADWLGIERGMLALVEVGRRSWPSGAGLQNLRLVQASRGLVLGMMGSSEPAPPPLPVPTPGAEPLEQRLDYCRYHLTRLGRELAQLRRKAAQYKARLVALPALRAWTGPVRNPEFEAKWLALFEQEAVAGLLNDCGKGPQRLLEARIAGLEREAELLAETLAELPPAAE